MALPSLMGRVGSGCSVSRSPGAAVMASSRRVVPRGPCLSHTPSRRIGPNDRPQGDSAAAPPLNRCAVTGGALRRVLGSLGAEPTADPVAAALDLIQGDAGVRPSKCSSRSACSVTGTRSRSARSHTSGRSHSRLRRPTRRPAAGRPHPCGTTLYGHTQRVPSTSPYGRLSRPRVIDYLPV